MQRNKHVMQAVAREGARSGLLVATKEPGYYTLGRGPGQVTSSDPTETSQTEVVCHTMREEHTYNLDRARWRTSCCLGLYKHWRNTESQRPRHHGLNTC